MEINEPIENYKTGFIAIYRSLKKHWIWNDPIKFKWWIDILLSVNYEDKKVNIGFQLFDCKRGQTVKSLMTWGKEWNVDKKTVHRFFELLKNDSMIVTENLQKTTRLTVCNYDSYQVNGHDKEPIRKRKGNARETQVDTNNKYNKVNKDNNKDTEFNFKNSLLYLGIEKQIVSDWLKVRAKKKAVNSETAYKSILKQIEISGLTANECIKKAVEKSWQGFEAEWIKDKKIDNITTTTKPKQEEPYV